MMTYTPMTSAYAEIAADVTALELIQVPHVADGTPVPLGIELVVAAGVPGASVNGLVLRAGETMTSTQIADMGTSGKLSGRVAVPRAGTWPTVSWGVLTK